MNIELKKAIIDYMLENKAEFQLLNCTINKFRAYIYDTNGDYLIGGKDVINFIELSEKLVKL